MLSVVVVIVSDTTRRRYDVEHLKGTLAALAAQAGAPQMEVIVPYLAPLDGVERLQHDFPDVRFIPCEHLRTYSPRGGGREHHDELRAIGIREARAELIAMLEDHGRPDEHWAARMVEAHQRPYAAVGGAIDNGVERPLNWAVYLCDFGRYQNPVPPGDSEFASDANICYKRSALDSIRRIWQDRYQETAVNWALRSRGEKLALAPGAVVYQHRLGLRLADALAERYIWGRSYAESRCRLLPRGRQLVLAALSPLLPPVLLLRMTRNAFRKQRRLDAFILAFPFTALLTASWAAGELAGYLVRQSHQPQEVRRAAGAH
jgi:hypothetical protein